MNPIENEMNKSHEEEKPPVLKTWNNIYLIVFLTLVILVIFFYIFTKAFD